MAQKVVTYTVDDLTGEDLGENGQTVKFGFGGTDYEIDLSEKNAAKFAKVLEPYIVSGKWIAKNGSRSKRTVLPSQRDQRHRAERLRKIRAWAAENGYTVSDRGRIPKHVEDDYDNSGSITFSE